MSETSDSKADFKTDLTNLLEHAKSHVFTETEAPVDSVINEFPTSDSSPVSSVAPSVEDFNQPSEEAPASELDFTLEPPVPSDSQSISAEPFTQSEPPSGSTTVSLPLTETIREQSESMRLQNLPVEAGFPFSVRIEGFLSAHHRARLLNLISEHKFGISEVDLEPQFQSGRILLPRISEYAAVLVFQALRDSEAIIRATPSDEEPHADIGDDETLNRDSGTSSLQQGSQNESALPLTLADSLPGLKDYQVIDTLTESAALSSEAVEVEKTHEFDSALERLKIALKRKATYKGADGLIHFTVTLQPLQLPSQYRLMAKAVAIKRSKT